MTQEEKQTKRAFFALYIYQPVWTNNTPWQKPKKLLPGQLYDISDDEYLELTDLRNITDEHANDCARLYGTCLSARVSIEFTFKDLWGYYTLVDGKVNKFLNIVDFPVQCTDYLRSKGYAIRFREYSVEDLVRMGWVKINNTQLTEKEGEK